MTLRNLFRTKEKQYFEGWYIKNTSSEHTFVLIPGISITDGKKEAFLQVILDQTSYFIPYDASLYKASRQGFHVQIGGNIFTRRGCRLNIHTDDLNIEGVIRFGKLNPLSYSAMGPLRLIPFLGCKHEVLSMDHALYGNLLVNGEQISFYNSRGYLESDSGTSFPESYFWSQCNHFKKPFTSIMAATADVAIGNHSFLGCIAVVFYKGKEYRFATYLGAKIRLYSKSRILLTQKNMVLKVALKRPNPVTLSAPINGAMIRSVDEQVNCTVHYQFSINNKVLIDETCERSCLEYSFISKVFLA